MKSISFLFLSLIFLIGFGSTELEAKKIKNTLTVGKTQKKEQKIIQEKEGRELNLLDSIIPIDDKCELMELKKISFVGYEKEPNSSMESFIIMNPGSERILGFKVKIDYLDMKGRMLHSRIIEEDCEVPSGENRKFDIGSWDKQHTYYYYLGNSPKKVATPFKVVFNPISYRIAD